MSHGSRPAPIAARPDPTAHQTAARRATLIWIALLLAILVWDGWNNRYAWQSARGWEQEEIAQSLATGHGFSFAARYRWLFSRSTTPDPDPWTAARGAQHYFPTAWESPLQPLLIAGASVSAGAYWGRFLVVACQAAFLLATAVLVFLLGRAVFEWRTGMIASLILLLEPHVVRLAFGTLTSATLAGLAVTTAACATLWCLRAISWRRALLLGAVLGGCLLASGATLLFIPVAVLLILLAPRGRGRMAWRAAVIVPAAAAVVISPWVIRNFLTFHQLVVDHDGFGEIALSGNPLLAETFTPGLHVCGAAPPPFTAVNGLAAVERARSNGGQKAMYAMADECVRQDAPPGYDRMNEAERDRVYLHHAESFAAAHPRLFATLTADKALAFFYTGWRPYVRLLALLALAGIVLTLRRPGPRALLLLVLTYSIPYVLAIPYFPRYRAPVEPLLLLFAIYPLAVLTSYCLRLAHRGEGRAGVRS
ncbi:MAG TPA: hypothetical protein VFW98_07545 [Gemmatimonadaceae bacterium]|nr:hypothetical protein [Gemmatimonadaceae bacterium]